MNTLRRIWAGWWRVGALAAVTALAPAPSSAQFCSNCIINSAAPQVAQFNVTSGTVRGILTVGTLNLTDLTLSGTATAAQFVGGGVGITGLNASALASGTVASARVAGAYTGITSVGTLSAGTWHGTRILPAYGGTGADLSAVAAGAVPYFITGGTQAALASPAGQRVLFTAGSGAAPVWVSSPTLTGENFSAIPLTALNSGTIPTSIAVSSNSIGYVQATTVHGNISGGAAFLTVALPIANLAAGTLPTSNAASSITVTGVAPGYYGGPSTLAQIHVNTDGRIDVAHQFNLVVYSTNVVPGPLPAGVTIAAAQITSGTLANNVIASSIAANGVSAGTYGSAAHYMTAAVGVDGRITSVSQGNIALPVTQINAGTLPSNVLVPAANVQAGNLGNSVVASSLAANGVAAGTYGSSLYSPQIAVGADGRITSVTQFQIPAVSTSAAWVDRNNNWTYPQTSQSSWTFKANLSGYTIAGLLFSGSGASLNHLVAANIDAGTMGPAVVASSIAARAVGDLQLTTTAVTAGTYGSASKSATVVVDAQGRITSASQNTIAISTGEFVGIVQPAHGGTGNDWSSIATGRIPYFTGTGTLGTLATSVNGYSMVQSGGVPSWAAAVSSATNLDGGATGGLHYQSAANTSAFLAAGTNGYTLVMSGGLPAWAANSSSATNIVGGAANSVPYQTAANTTAMLAAGNGVLQEVSSGAPAWTLSPTITGANITAIVAANISAGTLGPSVIASSVAATAVTAGSYGSASSVPTYTVGVDGRLTAASNTSIAIAESQVTNLTTDLATKASTGTNSSITSLTGLITITSAYTATSSMTNTSAGGLLVTSSVTAGAFFGDGSHLSGVISLSGTNALTGLNTFSGSGASGLVVSSSFTSGGYNILGAWQSFTPSFTASGSMTVSAGTVSNANYQIIGKTMCMNMYIYNMNIAGTPSTDIIMALPASKTSVTTSLGPSRVMDNSVWQTGTVSNVASGGLLWNKTDASNWTSGTGTTRVTFNGCFPIN